MDQMTLDISNLAFNSINQYRNGNDFFNVTKDILKKIKEITGAEDVSLLGIFGTFVFNVIAISSLDFSDLPKYQSLPNFIDLYNKNKTLIFDSDSPNNTIDEIDLEFFKKHNINKAISIPIFNNNKPVATLSISNFNSLTFKSIDSLSVLAYIIGERYIINVLQDSLIESSNNIISIFNKEALYSYEFDVNIGLIQKDIVLKNGFCLNKTVGLNSPFKFDDLSKSLNQVDVTNETNYITAQNLIDFYNQGIQTKEFEFYSKHSSIYIRISYYLTLEESTKHVHALVVATDITNLRKKQINEKIEFEKRKEEFEKNKNIFSTLSENYQTIGYCNMHSNSIEMIKVRDIEKKNLKEFYGSICNYSNVVDAYAQTYIDKKDIQNVYKCFGIENIKEQLKENKSVIYHFEFNDEPYNLNQKHIEARFTLCSSYEEGYFLLSIRCIDESLQKEAERQKEQEKIKKISEFLAQSYPTIVLYHFEDDSLSQIKMDENAHSSLIDIKSKGVDYVKNYAENYIVEADRKIFSTYFNPSNLRKEFTKRKQFSFRYEIIPNKNGERFFEATAVNFEEYNSAILAFKCIDNTIKLELEQITKANQIKAFSSLYFAVWQVDIVSDSVSFIRIPQSAKADISLGNNKIIPTLKILKEKFISDESLDKVKDYFDIEYIKNRFKKDDSFSCEYLGRFKGWVRTVYVCTDRDEFGDAKGFIIGAQSIEAEKQHELEQNARIEAALLQAEKANSAKTSFLSRMSHDIRTPLNGIIGLIELEERHNYDRTMIEENRKKQKVAANHLLSLINDVLELSKLDDENIKLAREPFDILELATDVLTISHMRASESGINLVHHNCAKFIHHKYIYGSPLHLRQILLNIISNSIKYNKVGGSVTTSMSEISDNEKVATIKFVIEDTGIGMSEEFLKKIFEPFTQERYDARSVYNGTGLGMSIVKKLIEKMNGTISITSTINVGSRFVVTIPFEVASEKDVLPELQENSTEVDLSKVHILLTEDNELNMEIATCILEDFGIKVTQAYNGQEALNIFTNSDPGTFDMILMDVMMPVMDGILATKAIRALQREDAKTIPICAMTANAFLEDRQNVINAGMNEHLPKPLDASRVIETIKKYVKK